MGWKRRELTGTRASNAKRPVKDIYRASLFLRLRTPAVEKPHHFRLAARLAHSNSRLFLAFREWK